MKQKILITGSNGLLGQKLVYALINDPDAELIATSRGENRMLMTDGYIYESLDITNRAEVLAIVTKHKPDTIINTAAMTNVDACEADKEGCDKLNVDAVKYLIEASKLNDVHLVHLSTDFIFDGENGPYTEDDELNPVSYYGRSKMLAEKLLQESDISWASLRTILVYGIVDNMSRSNIVLWAKGALEKGSPINVVNDQFRSPTLAEDLAQGCMLAAKQKAEGVYNISGKDFMSVLDIVEAVADYWKLDKSIISPISSATLNQDAKRPPKTGFVLDKAVQELGYKPHSFTEGLAILDKQLKERA